MILRFRRLRENAELPKRATPFSAGADLSACLEKPRQIMPHQIEIIPTGLSVTPSGKNVALLIYARSGLACKHGIALANGVGVVDADYRGEICVARI